MKTARAVFLKNLFFWFTFLFLGGATTGAQDPAIPTPKEFLGYELGEHFTPHYRVEAYGKQVAEVSRRVLFSTYGTTEEGRDLVLLTVSDPDNLSRLEEIRTRLLSLTDPRNMRPDQAETIIRNYPGVIWLSYGVHGSEACSSETAMKVLYYLASTDDPETLQWLKNLVILIDPMLNPDGRDRYVNWYNSVVGQHPDTDALAAEHQEPWPGGRTNHYLFDLNRDWAWMVQKETRLRLQQFHRWRPQVHVDFHEMGYTSTYFFFPAARPVNPILPEEVIKWGKIFGRGNAAMFDLHGIPYYSGEGFDLFYPGYGDCYPSFYGAIGMTYEQGGGGFAGLAIKRPNKTILTLKDRINGHYLSSLATIKTFAENKEARLRDFYHFWQEALDENKLNGVRFIFVNGSKNQAKNRAFVQLLLNHKIEVQRALHRFTVTAARYGEKAMKKMTFSAGSWVIDLLQPQGHLARALLEPEAQKLDTLFFYDIVSWSLPYALNLDAAWAAKAPSLRLKKIQQVPVFSLQPFSESTVGYLIRWDHLNAIRFLARCFREGINVRQSRRSFTLGGEKFAPGTLVILNHDNRQKEDLYHRVLTIARRSEVQVRAADSGFSEAGVDLGSPRVRPLYKPKILLVRGRPVSPTSMGTIWYLLEKQYDYPVTLLNFSQLKRADLSRYNVLILPADYGRGNGYKGALDSVTVKKIKDWISRGGMIVGIEGGAIFLGQDGVKLARIALRKEKKNTKKKEKLSPEEIKKRRRTVLEKEQDRTKERVPGTIVKVKIDSSHPLGFGVPRYAFVLKRSASVFELGKSGNNVGIFTDPAKVTGYMSEKNMKKVNGGVFVYHERLGRGNIVLFSDDPNFRGFWWGLTRLFFNSVFLFAPPE